MPIPGVQNNFKWEATLGIVDHHVPKGASAALSPTNAPNFAQQAFTQANVNLFRE